MQCPNCHQVIECPITVVGEVDVCSICAMAYYYTCRGCGVLEHRRYMSHDGVCETCWTGSAAVIAGQVNHVEVRA